MASASPPAVSVEHLTKTFGKVHALDDLSLSVRTGETYGLIGPNGSGKTTLIRVLLGLIRPNSGTVRVLDKPMPNRGVAKSIGYMTQASALYNELSIRENLAFFGGLYGLRGKALGGRIQQVIELVDLAERIDSPVSTLSGGMRQRVSLGCALLHEPRLLFLDEPTVGIDPELRLAFWDYFERLNQQGVTIIVSTHHLDEARRCSRLALIRFGKLLIADEPEELRRVSGEEDFDKAFMYFASRDEQPVA